jgi:hypothetical protein
MNLNDRARRGVDEIRAAVVAFDESEGAGDDSTQRFHRLRVRKRQRQRVGAVALSAIVAVSAFFLLVHAMTPARHRAPANATLPGGSILYGLLDPRSQLSHWFTVRPDGSGVQDLGISTTCAAWFPDRSKILISNDPALAQGGPLRPAVINQNGSGLRTLDATRDPNLSLGCGDVSPDGTRIALEGFGTSGHRNLNGIYTVRASDGGGLIRLLKGPIEPPHYSPDGSRLVFKRVVEATNPSGSGALFVMNADGSHVVRITPPGYVFDVPTWSPDGRWIAFQKPYGQLYLVHPDGSGLHRVPLQLPEGTGAQDPSWSPDGTIIVFDLQGAGRGGIYAVRPNGTGLREVVGAGNAQTPDWGRP